jgi:hypothetical protein
MNNFFFILCILLWGLTSYGQSQVLTTGNNLMNASDAKAADMSLEVMPAQGMMQVLCGGLIRVQHEFGYLMRPFTYRHGTH